MDEKLEQLLLLKNLTKKTGMLHEAQLAQLKAWPLALTHAYKCQIVFDYESKNLTYILSELNGRKPKDFLKRMAMLSKWTKQLLGDEYLVTVKSEKKVFFEG